MLKVKQVLKVKEVAVQVVKVVKAEPPQVLIHNSNIIIQVHSVVLTT